MSTVFRWIPADCPVEFVDARRRRLRSRSHARRLSIVEVSTGLTVETALAAIASSSVATALTMNSTGIPLLCISAIMLAIGVFKQTSPMRPDMSPRSHQPRRVSRGLVCE